MDSAKALLGTVKNDSCFPDLTFKERMTGFAACFVLGFVIEVFSFGSFLGILGGTPDKFAITYSLGNIISLMGTSFLVGPKKQCKDMAKPTRMVVSIVYVLSLAATIVTAVMKMSAFIVLACIIVQFCSLVWYVASYIPYGRKCLTMCLKKTANSVV